MAAYDTKKVIEIVKISLKKEGLNMNGDGLTLLGKKVFGDSLEGELYIAELILNCTDVLREKGYLSDSFVIKSYGKMLKIINHAGFDSYNSFNEAMEKSAEILYSLSK